MMTNVTAIVSMLHEPAGHNSADRRFRQQPILSWTLDRITRSQSVGSMAILCWEDQLPAVTPIAEEASAFVLAKGPRTPLLSVQAIAAAQRWADGWRGGLLHTCDFDQGFYAPWVNELIEKLSSDAVILINPAAALVDPALLDALVLHGSQRDTVELCFAPAPPGLGGVLLRPELVQRLATANMHPGRILHYLPDQPMREPLGGEMCVPVAASVSRSTRRFLLDSRRQIDRLDAASVHLNGQLVKSSAEDLINRLQWTPDVDPMPREVVLELTPRRATQPIFSPLSKQPIERPELSIDTARLIFDQLGKVDDLRLTLAGTGDPLLHEQMESIIALALESGIKAIHVETDLLPQRAEVVEWLAGSAIDVVSFHLPAMAPQTYERVMGADRFGEVVENIRRFIVARQQRNTRLPILVPLFTKCQVNLGEMETWYDQWLKALGAGVIVGPGTFGRLIDDCGVADMSPSRRGACVRIQSRLTILSDGRVASCENDVLARQVVGDLNSQTVADVWQRHFEPFRQQHRQGALQVLPVCSGCREWHRAS
jgi:hypothetical protein